MNSFATDKHFMISLRKGNLAELVFERLAVHNGWFVRYTGDQYHTTISPKVKTLVFNNKTPDFAICRNGEFKPKETLTVEVKATHKLSNRSPKRGKEDILVVLSTDGYKLFPKSAAQSLQFPESNWKDAVAFLNEKKDFGL